MTTLNKTQNVNAAVTGSVRKRAPFVVLGLIVALCIVFFLKQQANAPAGQDFVTAKLGDREFALKIANTPKTRERGLSHVPKIGENEGMLFEFEQPSEACFWMKDMKFNLDILWFDANQTLIYQKLDAKPESYPESFCSPINAKFVLEINAGSAKRLDVKLGDKLKLL